jgi:vitamin B12 transporter
MNKKLFFISAVFAFTTTCALAQEKDSTKTSYDFVDKTQGLEIKNLNEVVISDTKFAQSKEKSGKIISKITAEDLKNNPGQTVASILNTVAGLEVNGNQSSMGKNLGYYIRGGKSNQVLIVIDGVPITDASGINMEYDLRLLPVDQVESIEIMKGAASTLYGSGAATGVINITLKKANNSAISLSGYMQAGTNKTALNSDNIGRNISNGFSFSGKKPIFDYLFSLNNTQVNGISQIAASNNDVYEKDKFSRINYLSKIGVLVSKKFKLDIFGNYDKIENDYDLSFDNTGFNDTDLNKTSSKQYRLGISPKYNYSKGELVLQSNFTNLKRNYSEFNSYSNEINFSEYQSRSINIDGFNKYEFSKKIFLISGVQYQYHDMSTETPYDNIDKKNTKFIMTDPYFTAVFNSEFGLNLNFGARLNSHSQYGNQLVYNLNPSFDFKNFPLKIISSVSTAFVTPSLYQLYSQYGNILLTPEKNRTIEAGFEASFLKKTIQLNSVAFFREQSNFIGFYTNPITFEGNYVNIDGINNSRGFESESIFRFSKKIKLNLNYTFTQVDDLLNKLIPKHKLNAAMNMSIGSRTFLNINYQYTDKRNDAFFDGLTYETQRVVLGSYNIMNTSLKYDLVRNIVNVYGSVTNIFNTNFIENIGYSTRGRNFMLGLNVKL